MQKKTPQPAIVQILEKLLDKRNMDLRKDIHQDIRDEIVASEIRQNVKLLREIDKVREDARKHRDMILTREDKIVKELAQIREDRLFERDDLRKLSDHEERIAKLEKLQTQS